MATLKALQEPMDEPEMDDNLAEESAESSQPDGGNPDQMVGYIPNDAPAKVRVYLKAAQAALLNDEGAKLLRKVLGSSADHVKGIALIVGKTIDKLETKLGPLTDQENDQVAFFITGWLVSSLQAMGMPGLDDAQGRQDLIGRVLQTLDASQGAPQGAGPPAAPPQPGPATGAVEGPPMPPQEMVQ